MINIEDLGRKAIEIIKSNYALPDKGILAGGSIANIIWELVSGNKAKINDLDIFIKESDLNLDLDLYYVENNFKLKKNLIYRNSKFTQEYYESDYKSVCFHNNHNQSYIITESKKSGIYNIIKYKSTTNDYSIVIESFDINCVQVGYSIEEDKIYYTKDFENFINTGDLKICNLLTPPQTVMRLVKKQKDLNCNLDSDFEIKLVLTSLNIRFNDLVRFRFKDRYFNMFNDNKEILSKYFDMERSVEIENYIMLNFGDYSKIYCLSPKYNTISNINEFNFINSFEYLYYMRNIYQKEYLKELWKDLYYYMIDIDYLNDIILNYDSIDKEDIKLISRLLKYAPNTIERLRGFKLSEQINIFKKVLEEFKDPLLSISVLEKNKITPDYQFDRMTKLLLELSVRKNIITDKNQKVNKILGTNAVKYTPDGGNIAINTEINDASFFDLSR